MSSLNSPTVSECRGCGKVSDDKSFSKNLCDARVKRTCVKSIHIKKCTTCTQLLVMHFLFPTFVAQYKKIFLPKVLQCTHFSNTPTHES